MPLINLIREQRLAVRQREQKARSAFFGTLGLGGLAVLAAGAFLVDTARLNLEAMTLQAKKEKLAPMLSSLDEANKEIDELKPRIDILQKAQETTQKWNAILIHLSKNTPAGSWLTGIKTQQTDKNKPMTVTFDGVGPSQQAASEFTLRLTTCPELENPALKSTTETTAEGTTKMFSFEVSADLKGTAEDKPKEANKA